MNFGPKPMVEGAVLPPAAAGVPTGFLLAEQATPLQHRRVLSVQLLSATAFVAMLPFAQQQLPAVPAFIPIYEALLVMMDLITATLLYGQFRVRRQASLLMLVAAYLYTATLTVGHALSFPGLFAPTGLLGAGAQGTAWIYMLWHGGFPLFVIAYVGLSPRTGPLSRTAERALLLGSVALALVLLALATAGQSLLPAIMAQNRYAPAMAPTVASVWLLSLAALLCLLRRRSATVLDLWLVVVCTAWLFDIALSAMFNAGRFDLGFYAGRIYGLIACAVVLLELLFENALLYGRLAEAHESALRRGVELERARDEAQAGIRARDLFLASMAHEIRTPMNAAIGLTHLVLQTRLEPMQRDFLTKAHASSQALLRLLNHILDYSKAEAGKMELEREPFRLDEALESVGDLFAARASQAGVELRFAVAPEVPEQLVGDAMRLMQVLNNLTGNAVKFTERGEVLLAVRLLSREARQVRLEFSVQDTGIGMDPTQQSRLFEAFSQAAPDVARRHGGTGLGLAICRRLVALMGGQITLQSRRGEGTTVSFSAGFGLPADAEAPRRPLPARVLVLAPPGAARDRLQRQLEALDMTVDARALEEQARAHALGDFDEHWDLVALGWGSDDGALPAYLQRLLALLPDGPWPGLLVLSALPDPMADGAAPLPGLRVALVRLPLLRTRLREALVRLQSQSQSQTPSAAPADGPDFAALARELSGTRALVVDDNPVNREVASAYLRASGMASASAGSGAEALSLVRHEHFDLVLMDLEMPDMGGLEATRLIRAMPGREQLPILALSADSSDLLWEQCRDAGMDARLDKPIDPLAFARALRRWVRQPLPSR